MAQPEVEYLLSDSAGKIAEDLQGTLPGSIFRADFALSSVYDDPRIGTAARIAKERGVDIHVLTWPLLVKSLSGTNQLLTLAGDRTISLRHNDRITGWGWGSFTLGQTVEGLHLNMARKRTYGLDDRYWYAYSLNEANRISGGHIEVFDSEFQRVSPSEPYLLISEADLSKLEESMARRQLSFNMTGFGGVMSLEVVLRIARLAEPNLNLSLTSS